MATTWIKPIHTSGSVASKLTERIGYAIDFDKTENGLYIESYGCEPLTAASEFLFSKRLYAQKRNNNNGRSDILAYHIRQSFKYDEVTPEEALRVGYDLAKRWTKGRHQFIVAAHTNTKNPHIHIVFNAVNLEHTKKFRNFKFSSIALRRLSDQICLENGLSIVEKPGLSKGWNRAEYLSGEKVPSVRSRLQGIIDNNLVSGIGFDDFIAAMIEAGCEAKQGKHLAFKIPDSKKFIRCRSLGDDYTEDAISERLSGKRMVEPKHKTEPTEIETSTAINNNHKPNMLIDIQEKLRQGKGGGYEKWSRLFNIKEGAKTLIFLKENGVGSYEELVEKSGAASAEFNERLTKIKAIDKRLNEISELQKYIGQYGKTRDVYKAYSASGKDQNFYEANRAEITLHEAAKKYFNSLNLKKLPSIQELKQEYATLLSEKKKLYVGYKEIKENHRTLGVAKMNVERLLNITPDTQNRNVQRDNPHGK